MFDTPALAPEGVPDLPGAGLPGAESSVAEPCDAALYEAGLWSDEVWGWSQAGPSEDLEALFPPGAGDPNHHPTATAAPAGPAPPDPPELDPPF